jgi:hypothetical protein
MAPQKHLPAVLKSLRFHNRSTHELKAIPEKAWPALLDVTDRAHLTLALAARCQDSLPESARLRLDRNLADNAARHDRLIATHSQIVDALSMYGIEYVVLKGLSQARYIDDPRQRPQYDIDIYVPGRAMSAAAKALHALGYGFVSDTLDPGADHLPVMIRRTGWTWRGNYYDPAMPPSVELHFRFWNALSMRFDVGTLDQFWLRRSVRQIGALRFPTLDPADGLSYSALHLIRHLLGGDLRLRHVYEIAHFLDTSAYDRAFWSHWWETGLPSCRVMEGIAFRLARDWFHCELHPAAEETIDRLPSPIQRWFSLFASSPSLGIEHSHKNELWLHFCLLNNAKDRREIAVRRLFPARATRVLRDPHVASATAKTSPILCIKRTAFEAVFLLGRSLHHLRALLPTIHGAYLWRSACRFQADRKPSSGTAPL